MVNYLVACGGVSHKVAQADLDTEADTQAAAKPRLAVQPLNPWNHLELNNDPDHFQFAIVSDRAGGHRPGVFMDAVNKLNLLQPEFVMSVGDLIEGY